jgi:hypothetical protein
MLQSDIKRATECILTRDILSLRSDIPGAKECLLAGDILTQRSDISGAISFQALSFQRP